MGGGRPVRWRDAVLLSLRSFCNRHQTRAIERQAFLAEELDIIAAATGTVGLTPEQTLSRNLQALRDEGLVQFLGNGSYLLLDSPLVAVHALNLSGPSAAVKCRYAVCSADPCRTLGPGSSRRPSGDTGSRPAIRAAVAGSPEAGR
jgi:hypothetical protein